MNCFSGKKKWVTAVFFILALTVLVSCGENMETAEMIIGGRSFTVEIARSPSERQQGLMHREELGKNRGMLFVFEYDQKLSFWMKNTHIPLDIAYIAKDGTIKEIHRLKPRSEKPVQSVHSVRYALEVPQGTFEELGIGPGYKLKLPADL